MNTSKLFAQSEFDAVLIISPENRFYFTGFQSTEGYFVATKDKQIHFLDGRYIVDANVRPVDKNVENKLITNNAFAEIYDFLISNRVKRVAVEDDYLNIRQFNEIESVFESIEIVHLGEAVNDLRVIKQDYEIEQIMKAQFYTDSAYSKIFKYLKKGVTEKDIALELDFEMRRAGASGIAFDTIVAFGENSAKPHATPSLRKLKKGDVVLMDFGAKFGSYCSDMTRTVAFGDVPKQLKEIYKIVCEAQEYAFSNIKAGLTCKEADSFARDFIIANGYGDNFNHSLGHGVGICIHEKPTLSKKSDTVLQENMVITVEPGIYVEGLGGVRIENMGIVKKNELINITKSKNNFKTL